MEKRGRKPNIFTRHQETPAQTKSTDYIVIDYPREGELIVPTHYAVRIGASSNGYVELSVNGGDWVACRNAEGFWWYDWLSFAPGNYKIVARLMGDKGRVLKKSEVRNCMAVS